MSLRIDVQDRVLVLTLDREEARNAINNELRNALTSAWTRFRDDDRLLVAVLSGAGTAAFCAGADLKEMADYYQHMTALQRREYGERHPGLGGITRNLDPRKPVIAAINGACLAGGLELALACDIRIAARHATFGLPEVSRGILPGAGGTQRLPRLLPQGVALEMILTGATIDADAALRWGLVSHVVPGEGLMPLALELARRITANAPLAVRVARDAVYQGITLPLEQALRLEQLHAEPLRTTEDAREGVLAFVEKRAARFRGA